MGGSGSTRWAWHSKKVTVEECMRFSIFSLKSYLRPGYVGTMRWLRGEQVTGSINYRVRGGDSPEKIQLTYTITERLTGELINYDYPVQLQTTPLPWGGVRYWFTCPLVLDGCPCRRRVGVLYLPPGAEYFGCRHCQNLTYQSAQEKGQFDGLYQSLAVSMQVSHPGITGQDVGFILAGRKRNAPIGFQGRMAGFVFPGFTEPEPYAGYLSVEELCLQAGLSVNDLARLEAERLLLPDTKDGRYRPKLAGWGRKLAHLLEDGWEVDEIKYWSRVRFQMANPRQWPPDRREIQSLLEVSDGRAE